MTTQKLNRKRALAWRVGLTAALVLAGVYLLAAHWSTFSASFRTALHAHAGWLLLILLLMVGSFCIAAFTYQVLALKRLWYRQTLLVEIAGSFVGRLLPAGLGGLGLNGVYLYKKKHTPAEATAVISVNNLLGMCAHGLLLVVLCIFQPETLRTLLAHYHFHVSWLWVATLAFAVLSCLAVSRIRAQVARFARNLLVSVRKVRPGKLALALLSSMLLTATYTLVLYCASEAVNAHVGVLGIFIIFSLGMLVGTATPTPGGLVGTEAGLFAGFISFGAPDTSAGAAVLLFRLATYWLPIVPGVIALAMARNRKLL